MLDDKNHSFTPISDLGEFKLINILTKDISLSQKSTLKGIGDDAAHLKFNSKEELLITTDLLVEGIHFDLDYVPLVHLGYKAVVVNLSDIYAMGGKPTHITVSIALSNYISVEDISKLYQGINKACAKYQVDLIGGDTTSAQKGLVISITAIGISQKNTPIYRSGAKPNDLIVVSGDLGAAFMGLQILKREQGIFKELSQAPQPDLSPYNYIIERQIKPEARRDIVEQLQKLDIIPTAMIDISDGLSSEIHHIANASNVGFKIFENKLPIDPLTISTCEELNLSPTNIALHGGEDYELLCTLSLSDAEKIKSLKGVSIIGHILENTDCKQLISTNSTEIPLEPLGWTAFNNK